VQFIASSLKMSREGMKLNKSDLKKSKKFITLSGKATLIRTKMPKL
jgi:hypothetical protein